MSSRSKRDGPLWQPAPKLHDVGYRRGRRAMLQINHTPYRHRGRFIAVALLRAHHKNTQDPRHTRIATTSCDLSFSSC